MTGPGMLARPPMARGESAMSASATPAGTRANRDAHPVAAMTPGESEKFTGPITPVRPARALPSPVTATPRFVRSPILSAARRPPTDWMDPRSLMASARKQIRNAARTPISGTESGASRVPGNASSAVPSAGRGTAPKRAT